MGKHPVGTIRWVRPHKRKLGYNSIVEEATRAVYSEYGEPEVDAGSRTRTRLLCAVSAISIRELNHLLSRLSAFRAAPFCFSRFIPRSVRQWHCSRHCHRRYPHARSKRPQRLGYTCPLHVTPPWHFLSLRAVRTRRFLILSEIPLRDIKPRQFRLRFASAATNNGGFWTICLCDEVQPAAGLYTYIRERWYTISWILRMRACMYMRARLYVCVCSMQLYELQIHQKCNLCTQRRI